MKTNKYFLITKKTCKIIFSFLFFEFWRHIWIGLTHLRYPRKISKVENDFTSFFNQLLLYNIPGLNKMWSKSCLSSKSVLLEGHVTKYFVSFKKVCSSSNVRCSRDDLLNKCEITKKPRPIKERLIIKNLYAFIFLVVPLTFLLIRIFFWCDWNVLFSWIIAWHLFRLLETLTKKDELSQVWLWTG